MIILTRNHKDIEIPRTAAAVQGEYNLVITRLDGSTRETGWFPNLITDIGLNRWGTNSVISQAVIGTGTSTPLVTDSALTSYSATTTSYVSSPTMSPLGSSPYYMTTTIGFRFPVGSLNGNYTELGLGWDDTHLFSKALIIDSFGAPTTISVSPSEALDVYYRIKMYPPLSDVVTTATIGSRSYTVTTRAIRVNVPANGYGTGWGADPQNSMRIHPSNGPLTYSGAIGAITDLAPTGSSSSLAVGTTIVEDAYTNGSLTRSFSLGWGLDDGITPGGAGVKSTYYYGYFGAYQYGFVDTIDGTGIPKDSTKTLTLHFTVSWGRYP